MYIEINLNIYPPLFGTISTGRRRSAPEPLGPDPDPAPGDGEGVG